MTFPRDAWRVRRYLDGELVDEVAVARGNLEAIAASHGEWARMVLEAGASYRIVVDDPAGDVPLLMVLEGGDAS